MLYSDDKKWIRKTLVKEDIIKNKKHAKHMFTHCDLTNIIVSMWTDDDPVFIHERHRIQMTFAILIYCYSGARIGVFIPIHQKQMIGDSDMRYGLLSYVIGHVSEWL